MKRAVHDMTQLSNSHWSTAPPACLEPPHAARPKFQKIQCTFPHWFSLASSKMIQVVLYCAGARVYRRDLWRSKWTLRLVFYFLGISTFPFGGSLAPAKEQVTQSLAKPWSPSLSPPGESRVLSLCYVNTLLTFGKAFVLCRWLAVLTLQRGDRRAFFLLRYVSTLLTFGKAFVLCQWLTVLTLRRGDLWRVDP